MSKKITSLILSLVLLLTTLTVSPISEVWAEPEDEPETGFSYDGRDIPAEDTAVTVSDGEVAVQGILPSGIVVEAEPILPALNPQKLNGIGTSLQPMGSGMEVDPQNPSDEFLAVYDIKLLKDGEYVQPEKPVKVTISGLTLSGNKAQVLHILEDDGLISAGLLAGTVKTVSEGSLFELANDAAKEAAKKAAGSDGSIAYEILDATIDGDSVSFIASSFSIYAIIEGGEDQKVPRIRYYFQDAEGNQFLFLNEVEELVDNQIIKDGDSLDDVGLPEIGPGQRFNGWYLYTVNGETVTWGAQIQFDQTISVSWGDSSSVTSTSAIIAESDLDEDGTYHVIVRPNYGEVRYITFYEDSSGTNIYTKLQVPKGSEYNISLQQLQSPDSEMAFIGWNAEPGTDDDNRQAISGSALTITVDEDVSFFPVFKRGSWIHFHTGPVSSGATYIAPVFVVAGDTAAGAEPDNPTWKGYQFRYWTQTDLFTGQNGAYVEPSSQPQRFNFNSTLSGDITLYAYWSSSTTSYTVVFWHQNVTDSKSATNAQKTYSFASQNTEHGISNTTVLASSYTAPTGFVLNTVKSDTSTVINADGTSIINIYYDRQLMYMKFYRQGNQTSAPGYNSDYYNTATGNNRVTVFSGLYGQTLEQNGYSWPSGQMWNYYQTATQTLGMSYLGQFVFPSEMGNATEMRLYYAGSYTATVEFYLQGVDGTYPTNPTDVGNITSGSNTTFYLSEKYDGFKVVAYRRYTDDHDWADSDWVPASDGTPVPTGSSGGGGCGGGCGGGSSVSYGIAIRYERRTFQLKYLDSEDNTELPGISSVTMRYGESVSGSEPTGFTPVSQSAGKEWDGKWYKDQTCSEEFDWSVTMPNSDLVVYAGWKSLRYRVIINPNGGALTPTESTYFNVIHGSEDNKIQEYTDITRDFVEDADGTFYYYFVDYAKIASGAAAEPNHRMANYILTDGTAWSDGEGGTTASILWNQTAINASDAVDEFKETGTKYKYEKGAYALIGWYEITFADGHFGDLAYKTGESVYNFDTEVEHPTYLMAKWRRVGEYKIRYVSEAYEIDANGIVHTDTTGLVATAVQSDNSSYADNSESAFIVAPDSTIVVSSGEDSERYIFQGWYFDGQIHQPGETFHVKASLAEDVIENDIVTKVIYVHPVFIKAENLPVQVTQITFNGNGGTTSSNQTTVTYEDLQLNSTMTLTDEGFTRTGYTFKGWAESTHGPVKYQVGDVVGIDNVDEDNNILYAVWEVNKFTVTVKKVITGEDAEIKKSTFTFTPTFGSLTSYNSNFLLAGLAYTTEEYSYVTEKTFENVPYGEGVSFLEAYDTTKWDTPVVSAVRTSDSEGNTVSPVTLSGVSNGSQITVEGDIEITFTNTRKEADYTVHYHLENVDGTFTEVTADVLTKHGYTGEFMTVEDNERNSYSGYVLDEALAAWSPATGLILADGTSRIDLYYRKLVTFTVTKVWSDGDDRDRKRPESISLQLLVNGAASSDYAAVTANGTGNSWTYTWENLPMRNTDGTISYSVQETTVPTGYTSVVTITAMQDLETGNWTQTITNSYTPETIDITVTKTWSDDNNRDGKRQTATITLNGIDAAQSSISATRTVNTTDGTQTFTWTGLYKYANGEAIEYSVTETEIDGYSTEITGSAAAGFQVTNTHTPELVDVTIVKVWDDDNNRDGKRPTSLVMTLSNGETVTVDADGSWTGTIEDQYKYANGSLITYTWTEGTLPTGYSLTKTETSSDGYTTTLTNSYTPERTKLTVTKTWADENNQDGKRAAATLKLYKKVGGTTTEVEEVTVTTADDWSKVWENLYVYEGGQQITYFVVETLPENSEYEKSGDGEANGKAAVKTDSGTIAIVNSYTPETTKVTVVKKWEDTNNQDGKRAAEAQSTVTLYRKLGLNGTPEAVPGCTYTGIPLTDGTITSWENLPVYSNGTKWYYYVVETLASGTNAYSITYSADLEAVKDDSGTITITNSHPVILTKLTITKTWSDNNDQDGKRAAASAATIQLWKKVGNGEPETVGSAITIGEGTSWTIENLPVYASGVAITYYVVETLPDGSEYTVSYSNNNITASEVANIGTIAVTNTYEPKKTTVTVTKVWDDSNDQDGKRPETVTMQLWKLVGETATALEGKTATFGANENWTASWTDLPVFEGGVQIKYFVVETQPTNYTKSGDGQTSAVLAVEGTGTTQSTTTLGDVTNSYEPEKVKVTVKKTWNDGQNRDGIRPESVQVILTGTANGTQVSTETVTLNASTNWQKVWTTLPAYSNGNLITYSVTEVRTSVITGTDGVGTYAEMIAVAQAADGSITFTVTNTHTPATTYRTVKKVWDDDNDRDRVRPTSLTLTLKGTVEGVSSVVYLKSDIVVDAAGNWQATVSNLYAYYEGKEITYTFTEPDTISNYTKTGQESVGMVTTITNKHDPATISVSFVKVWNDDDNRDNVRPANTDLSITLGTGTSTQSGITKTVNPDADGKYTWSGLYKYEAGQEISYTVGEAAITDYTAGTPVKTTDSDGNITYTITNTHTPEKVSVTVTKEWADGNNQDGIRPGSVQIVLSGLDGDQATGDNAVTPTATLSGSTWTYTWSNLYKYKAGTAITYTVDETPTSVITGTDGHGTYAYAVGENTGTNGNFAYKVTNTHTPETVKVVVSKVWDDDNNRDGKRPESLTVTLSNGETVILTPANEWTASIDNLPKYARTTTPVVYTWTEPAITGYTEPADSRTEVQENNVYTTTITNHHDPERISVTVKKVWSDDNDRDGLRQPATITLQNVDTDQTGITAAQTTDTSDNWTYTWENLYKYKKGEVGQEIAYTVMETSVPTGYTAAVSGSIANGFTVTNTHTPAVRSITVTKIWEDGENRDAIRPDSVEVTLQGIDTTDEGQAAITATVTLSGNTWTYTWEGLFVNKGGQEIQYSVLETKQGVITGTDTVGQYSITYGGTMAEGLTVTNKHTPETVDVTVTKVWNDNNDQDGKRPATITVNLLADGTAVDQTGITPSVAIGPAVTGVSVSQDGNSWTYTWTGLYKYDFSTTPIVYSVTEDDVTGYIGTVSSYTITNVHEPETITFTVEKIWDDDDNRDNKRPTSVTVHVFRQGETAAVKTASITKDAETGKWTVSFTVDKYVPGQVGEEAVYTITEDEVQYYATILDTKTIADGVNFEVKNSYTPETRNITVTKVWDDSDDMDGKRPESVTIQLYADGVAVNGKTLYLAANDDDADLDWKDTFRNLLKYRDQGVEIIYTIAEVIPANSTLATYYNLETEGKPGIAGTMAGGFTVTNKHVPLTRDVVVTKTWEDASNQDGKRPDSLTVTLYANGQEAGATGTWTKNGNTWTYTFSGLQVYSYGEMIAYTVDETEANVPAGYSKAVEKTSGTDTETDPVCWTVTNTHTPETVTVTITKKWDDNNNAANKRPTAGLTVTVKGGVQNETVVLPFESDAAKDWTKTVTLEKYLKGAVGQLITYTVEETVPADYDQVGDPAVVMLAGTTELDELTGTITSWEFTVTNRIREGKLTITKIVADQSGQAVNGAEEAQTFLFRVEGVGSSTKDIDMVLAIDFPAGTKEKSVTITGLPIGDYIVYELGDWSWRYQKTSWSWNKMASGTQTFTTAADGQAAAIEVYGALTTTLKFTNTRTNWDWLSGNAYKANEFGEADTPIVPEDPAPCEQLGTLHFFTTKVLSYDSGTDTTTLAGIQYIYNDVGNLHFAGDALTIRVSGNDTEVGKFYYFDGQSYILCDPQYHG